MFRSDFFKWLNECPTGWVQSESDNVGYVTVTFINIDEDPEEGDYDEDEE